MERTLTPNELDRVLEEAVNALHGRSLVLEKAPSMSKKELEREINHRIDLVMGGTITEEEELNQVKAEAKALAALKLRRG